MKGRRINQFVPWYSAIHNSLCPVGPGCLKSYAGTIKLSQFSSLTHSLFFLLSHDNNLSSHAPLLTLSAPFPVHTQEGPTPWDSLPRHCTSTKGVERNSVLSCSHIFFSHPFQHFFIFVKFLLLVLFIFLTHAHVWGVVSLTQTLIV